MRQMAENSNNWFAREGRSIVERYVNCEFEIYIYLRSKGSGQDYQFILAAIPSRCWDGEVDGSSGAAVNEYTVGIEAEVGGANWDHGLVLGLGQFVHGPEGVIAALVGLRVGEQCDDLSRQVLAAPLDYIAKIKQVVCDGEVCGLRVRLAGENGTGVPGLVQRMPESFDRVLSSVCNDVGREVENSDLVGLGACLSVRINNVGVAVAIIEPLTSKFNTPNVFLRPSELLFGRAEGIICHGGNALE